MQYALSLDQRSPLLRCALRADIVNGRTLRTSLPARCVCVLPALSAQNSSYLHKSMVGDHYASSIWAAGVRALCSERPSVCAGRHIVHQTHSALLVRFGPNGPILGTRRGVAHHSNAEGTNLAYQCLSGSSGGFAGTQSGLWPSASKR